MVPAKLILRDRNSARQLQLVSQADESQIYQQVSSLNRVTDGESEIYLQIDLDGQSRARGINDGVNTKKNIGGREGGGWGRSCKRCSVNLRELQ